MVIIIKTCSFRKSSDPPFVFLKPKCNFLFPNIQTHLPEEVICYFIKGLCKLRIPELLSLHCFFFFFVISKETSWDVVSFPTCYISWCVFSFSIKNPKKCFPFLISAVMETPCFGACLCIIRCNTETSRNGGQEHTENYLGQTQTQANAEAHSIWVATSELQHDEPYPIPWPFPSAPELHLPSQAAPETRPNPVYPAKEKPISTNGEAGREECHQEKWPGMTLKCTMGWLPHAEPVN